MLFVASTLLKKNSEHALEKSEIIIHARGDIQERSRNK